MEGKVYRLKFCLCFSIPSKPPYFPSSTSTMSSERQPQHRLTSRQASAQAQRKAMTEGRQRLTERIRKQKKSDWLAQKRGVTASVAAGDTSSNASSTPELSQAMNEFLRQIPVSVQSLKVLSSSLQLSTLLASWTLDDTTQKVEAQKLVQRLDETLTHAVGNNDLDVVFLLVQILAQLVAMSAASKTRSRNSYNNQHEEDTGYYGRHSVTWSELIVEESQIKAKIPLILSCVSASHAGLSEQTLQVVEQTCWFLGNLAQDMPASCSRLRQEGSLVPPLTSILSLIQQQRSSETNTASTIAVVQAAAWAFHNLIKGDVKAMGLEYCDLSSHPGMHPGLASALLTLSVPVIQTSMQLHTRYIDVSVQTAWILVHLSQRDDAVVDFLLYSDTNTDIVRDVLERLYQVCDGAHQQQKQNDVTMSPGRPNYFHHPLLEPCLEVLGHWSTAGNGKHVPRLLAKTQGTSRVPEELSLLPILMTLLQWGQEGLLQTVDYLQALWLSGCLLVDAGRSNHPSTALAMPSLVPLLTRGLIDTNTSRSNSLELKREGVLALWNAISAPPIEEDGKEEPVMMLATKRSILQRILSATTSSDTDMEDTSNNSTHTVLMALKNLLLCQDVDVLLAAMNVLNAILRHIPSTRIAFVEVNGDDALETVCDLPLGNDRASSDAADMAAQLIDDFFDSDHVDDGQFADPVLQPSQAGGVFVFGMDPALQRAPIFLPDLHPPMDNAGMGGIFPAIAPVGETVVPGMGRGVGRGRGRDMNLPAWAVQLKTSMDMAL
jgi:hypothetical protein